MQIAPFLLHYFNPVWFYYIYFFLHYLINGMIFGGEKSYLT